MSRAAVFKGILRQPKLLHDIAQALASIEKSISLHIDETSVNCHSIHREFEVWVQVNNETLFSTSGFDQSLQCQLSGEALARALYNDPGSSNVQFVVERKSNEVLMISIKMDAVDVGTLSVRQRIYAHYLERDSMRMEPQISEGALYCKLKRSQLAQLAKISDKYRQMSPQIQITIKKHHIDDISVDLTLSATQPGLVTTTTMEVTSVSLYSSQDDGVQPTSDSVSITVKSKDWYTMLGVRKLADHVVLGLADENLIAVYSQLGKHESDTITYYIFQTLS